MTEDEVKAAFVKAFNRLVSEKEEILANAKAIRETLCDTDELEREKASLQEELAVVVEMTQGCVAENARIAQDQEAYQRRYDGLVARYDKAKARLDEVTAAITAKELQRERLTGFIETLARQGEPLEDFDKQMWSGLVDCVTVGKGGSMTVEFRDGTRV